MINPPSGTVTFLFTDIEGSTQLTLQHPDAMPAALERHRALLEQAINAQGGYVFRTLGDEFEVAFATASQGLATALTSQRLLQNADWSETGPLKVRMGLHTGPATPRGDDYDGYLTLAHAKRLMSTAYGEQVLVSQATQVLLHDQLPDGVELRDLGEHRLKGFDRVEHIYQVSSSDLNSEFPQLASLAIHPNNLPIQLTSFIGRENELRELDELLKTNRLLTLTGPGGTGKTRLSLELGKEVLESFADGVWVAELAPLTDPALVPQAVATALNVRELPGRTLIDALLDYVRAKNLLLILDNCEHLIDASAQLAETLLQAAPGVKIVATSRESLGITGEQTARVPPLSVPDLREELDYEELASSDCVWLFVDRATAASPRFRLTEKNAASIAQICVRLDGIPLAVELAAARIKAFTPEQIAARLDDRFRLLTGGSRTALERHQTLGALIDWSYNLLMEEERSLLRRLSVFAGGWSYEAAQEVCGDKPEADVLNLLPRLVDKSLVAIDEEQEGRYRMLETIRQYAWDKLSESGEADRLRDRHLDYMIRFTGEAEPELRSVRQLEWLERMESEHDNIRAGLEWALEHGQVAAALQLASAAEPFWSIRGYWSEGHRWLDAALKADEDSSRAREHGTDAACRAKALHADGVIQFNASAGAVANARPMLEFSLQVWREANDTWWTALVLKDLAQLSLMTGETQMAREELNESIALARQTGDKWLLGTCLAKLGAMLTGTDELARARELMDEAVALAREAGDKSALSYALTNLFAVYFLQGEFQAALPLAEEGLAAAREIGSLYDIMTGLRMVGFGAAAQGNHSQAAEYFSEMLRLAQEAGGSVPLMLSLLAFTTLALYRGHGERGARIFGAALAVGRAAGIDPRNWTGVTGALTNYFLKMGSALLDEKAIEAATAEGATLTPEQALALAMQDADTEASKNPLR